MIILFSSSSPNPLILLASRFVNMTDDTTPTNASPDEPTPAASTAYPESDNAANAAIVGRPTPSPDQLVPQTTSAAKFDSSSSPSEDVEVGGEPSNDFTPEKEDDTTSQSGNATMMAGRLDDVKDSFISTPSPFKKQVAALAGINDDSSRSERTQSIVSNDNVGHEHMELPPLPPTHMQLPPLQPAPVYTPARDHLLAEMMQSPDLEDANVCDYDHLGSECLASASTASGMLSRTDGFDTMPGLFPGIDIDSSGSYGGAMTVQRNSSGLDMTQFVMYPTRDPFPLPPVLQAHLNETYAASSVVLTRVEGGGEDGAHRGLYQVTSYRPHNGEGRDGSNVPGTTPLAYPSFRGVASSPNHLGGTIIEFGGETAARGKTLVQLSQLPQRFTDNNSKKKTVVARSLPFRKRPVEEEDSNEDDEEYSPPGSVVVAKKKLPLAENKNVLVRHNVRTLADGERVSCKCKKSQCLKLYCDCFQQNLMCTADCECEKCKNTEANDRPGGSRAEAVAEIKLRRPDAFKPRTRDAGEGCKCKKNKCLKKYCLCFNQGVKCDNRCRCRDCENQPVADDEEKEENVRVIKVRLNPPTRKVVVSKKKAKKEPVLTNMSVVYGMGSPPAHSEQQYDVEAV